MKMLRRVLIVLAVVLLLPLTARAAGSTLIVEFKPGGEPAAGVTFDVFALDKSYPDARSAYAAICKDGKEPVASGVTNKWGRLEIDDLDNGKYLVVGRPYRTGNKICEPEMCLVTFPVKDDQGNVLESGLLMPKYAMKDQGIIDYNLVVIWNDNNYSGRPKQVKVGTYRNEGLHTVVTVKRDAKPSLSYADGTVYAVSLSSANTLTDTGYNWRYSWEEEDETAIWAVLEDVPSGYTATYDREGNTFYIINTRKDPGPGGSGSSGGKLPQTGQVWWPVPVLTLAGIALLMAGWIRRKESWDER